MSDAADPVAADDQLADPGPPSGPPGRRAAAIVAAAVVLLVVVGGAMWLVASDGDDPDGAGAPTTAVPPEPEQPALLVSCGEIPYPVSALSSPTGVEDDPDPAAAGLRALIADPNGIGPIPETGWRRLYDEGGRAVFSHGELGDDYVEVELEEEDGTFGFAGSSHGCARASVDVGDRSRVGFRLPAGEAPDPDATTLTVLVSEAACTGGQPMGDRLAEPVVVADDQTIGLLFTADPLPAGAYTCPGNPEEEVTVPLDEPVGTRRVVNLATYPPADAAQED